MWIYLLQVQAEPGLLIASARDVNTGSWPSLPVELDEPGWESREKEMLNAPAVTQKDSSLSLPPKGFFFLAKVLAFLGVFCFVVTQTHRVSNSCPWVISKSLFLFLGVHIEPPNTWKTRRCAGSRMMSCSPQPSGSVFIPQMRVCSSPHHHHHSLALK